MGYAQHDTKHSIQNHVNHNSGHNDHAKKEPEKKFALKEALERAMKEQKEIIEKQNERLRQGATPQSKVGSKEEPFAHEEKKENNTAKSHNEVKEDSVREVPEDVLRKVLE